MPTHVTQIIEPTLADGPLFSVPPGAVVPFAKVPFNKEYWLLGRNRKSFAERDLNDLTKVKDLTLIEISKYDD